MAADKMDEILKHFPDLEEGWKEMEEKLKTDPAKREMLSLRYRKMLEMEKLKENLPEPEFTKAKRVESDSKVMKANEAPEKLYFFEGEPILSARSKKREDANIEYTRTDAFIEKACEWLEPVLKNYAGYYAGADTLGDFRKYMKGE